MVNESDKPTIRYPSLRSTLRRPNATDMILPRIIHHKPSLNTSADPAPRAPSASIKLSARRPQTVAVAVERPLRSVEWL